MSRRNDSLFEREDRKQVCVLFESRFCNFDKFRMICAAELAEDNGWELLSLLDLEQLWEGYFMVNNA